MTFQNQGLDAFTYHIASTNAETGKSIVNSWLSLGDRVARQEGSDAVRMFRLDSPQFSLLLSMWVNHSSNSGTDQIIFDTGSLKETGKPLSAGGFALILDNISVKFRYRERSTLVYSEMSELISTPDFAWYPPSDNKVADPGPTHVGVGIHKWNGDFWADMYIDGTLRHSMLLPTAAPPIPDPDVGLVLYGEATDFSEAAPTAGTVFGAAITGEQASSFYCIRSDVKSLHRYASSIMLDNYEARLAEPFTGRRL